MNTLVYLNYGQGLHVGEPVFSILSALHHCGPAKPSFRIVIYTDDARPFKDLPVDIFHLDDGKLRDWAGPHGYKHRRKIMTMVDALGRYPGRVALVDGDTWFKRSPDALFGRIAPGRACLHLAEGRIVSVRDGFGYDALASFLESEALVDRGGHELIITHNPMMWNSGVIGLHSADAALLADVLHLMDQVWSRFQGVHTIEQFALGHVIEKRLKISTADDVVFHYWMDVLRTPFQKRLPSLLTETIATSVGRRADRLYAHRPRPRLRRRVKLAFVHRLQRFGLLRHRMRASG